MRNISRFFKLSSQATWVALIVLSVNMLQAQEKFSDQDLEFFESKVRPILVNRCFECHGPEASPLEGSLSLASREDILEGGDSGPALVPKDPSDSLLIDTVNYGELYEMPPEGKLPDEEIAVLTKWVELGAPWPKEQNPKTAKREKFDLEARRNEHWSWALPKYNSPTQPADAKTWPSDPVDQFIVAKLLEKKLTPTTKADRRTLIRRITFDLTGIAPTAEEVRNYVSDPSPNATEKLIDRLLASSRFGERWARHWLDLVRYAESCGHEFDYPIPHAHKYRDYLIRAFNQDVPYDQLIKEHIAGDLLGDPRLNPSEKFNESVIGTGMWYLGEDVHGPVDVRAHLASRIDNQIDVMSKSFLGLTVACARCHDHKFDAISTEDYYALAGYLKSSRRQLAMLDPGQKIESAFEKVRRQLAEADKLSEKYVAAIKSGDQDKFADYLAAAMDVLRENRSWLAEGSRKIQGETLKAKSVPNGIVEVQTIRPQNQFSWEGDKQIWWRDGKVGDEITIEFKNPFPKKLECEVRARFTVAGDYGVADFSVNKGAATRIDFFGTELATREETLGVVNLEDRNQIVIKLAKANPQAIQRNMVGIDSLTFVPKAETTTPLEQTVASVAKAAELEHDLLSRLANAIVTTRTKPNHPLHFVREIAATKGSIQPLVEAAKKLTGSAAENAPTGVKTFESFDNGITDGWTTTGFAFNESNPANQPFALAGPALTGSGYVSSARYGKQFEGVLRSPTFTLEDDVIHYRVRGENIHIRLVVENYRMDDYNALLFRGFHVRNKSVPEFAWVSHSGDMRLQKGKRAHLEIIDEGDGWVEIDEIVFGPRRSEKQTTPVTQLLADLDSRAEDATRSFARSIANWLGGNHGSKMDNEARLALANWLLANRLGDLVSDDLSNVSLDSPSAPIKFVENQLNDLRADLAQLAASAPRPQFVQAMTDGTGEDEHIFIRGNHKNLGKVAPRKFLTALDPTGESHREATAKPGSGRLALAERIASPENPLTSRVIVNRIWHHLMGRGIVATVDNFGVLGKQPTHPELLDYLAHEMVNSNWSVKKMIKRIMLTEAYQRSSSVAAAQNQEIDPDNLFLHRANIKRLSGEAIRDTMLAISGRLTETMYGPPVPIYLTEFMQGRGRPGRSGPLDGDGRRSIYIAVRRNFLSPMMLAFDTPIPFNTIGRRNRSNVPAQALILMNDPLVLDLAKSWAEKLVAENQPIEARIRTIYESAFATEPTSQDIASAMQFLKQQATALGVEDSKIQTSVPVWKDFCHVMFNVKNFIFIH